MKSFITILILVVVLGGGYYLFTQSDTPSEGDAMMGESKDSSAMMDEDDAMMEKDGEVMMEKGDSAMMDDGTPMTGGSMMEDSGVKEFTIEGGNFFFSPNTMTVKKGDTVRVTFKNVDGFHDFVIDEFNVATPQIAANNEVTVEFVADTEGVYEYYCSVGSHRQQGMVGTLTVIE